VTKREPPPLGDRDVRERGDGEGVAAAEAYPEAKRAADVSAKALDAAKAA
jgi:hypothetical protein